MKKMKIMLKKIFEPYTYSSEAYIEYLKKSGIDIGEGCVVFSPRNTEIDVQRPHMLEIGNYVKITSGVKILTHDYSRSVLCNLKDYGNIGDSGITHIGNNVFIGVNSTILMGSNIGDNCIIGAGSIVTGNYHENSVIAGNPAKTICSIDEFYNKKKQNEIKAAKQYVYSWRRKYNRDPNIYEMTNSFSWLYLPRTKDTFAKYSSLFNLNGIDVELYKQTFLKSKPIYKSFTEFIKDCNP